jgi:hypothetical protein
MKRVIFPLGFVLATFCLAQSPHKNKILAHFKAIEAYEVRPGILLQPRYTAEGQICEIGLERLHYSAGEVSMMRHRFDGV